MTETEPEERTDEMQALIAAAQKAVAILREIDGNQSGSIRDCADELEAALGATSPQTEQIPSGYPSSTVPGDAGRQSPIDATRQQAEELWEEIGVCRCTLAEASIWCETCQQRIASIESALKRGLERNHEPNL